MLCAALLSLAATASTTDTSLIRVPAGADLQQAIERARPGDTILLDAGATYTGNFRLMPHQGGAFITIRTRGDDGLPAAGERIGPEHAPRLARLRSPNRQPVLTTAPAAHHWRLQLLEFLPTADGHGDIVALGDGGAAQNDPAHVPRHLVIDRCYIHGDPQKGQKRGIALNSGETTVTGSYIADIKAIGQDTQAIAGWNGPGPYTIENNYIEAAGENFLLGGADPSIRDLVTSDVVFRGNHLAKPAAWRALKWQVKNLFELKNARRVTVEHNLMEYTWASAQVGYAMLLTPRNQDGRAPWATVEDVTIRHNIVRHAAAGVQITGADTTHPSRPARGITIADNLFYGIDGEKWGGPGIFLLIGDGPSDVSIERNTISQSGNILSAYGGTPQEPTPVRKFVFRDNLVRHNAYGVHGADRSPGLDTLNAFFPDGVFTGNGIAGGDEARYPRGNTFIDAAEFDRQFEDAAAGNFRLKSGSRFRGGAEISALRAPARR